MILVTGATGDVGGGVVRRLLAAGEKVRVLARDPAKAAKLGDVDVAKGDLLDPAALATAMTGAHKLFLMAHARDLPPVAENAVAAALAAGVRHVVLLSSYTVATHPTTAIGKWHHLAEQAIEKTKLAWTMLRPGNFASNTLRWVPTIKGQGSVFSPDGASTSAPIDPADIAAVGAAALTGSGHEGKRYVLTSEETLSVKEQVETIARVIGKPIRFVDVPPEAARAGMLKAGFDAELVDAVLELRGTAGSLQTTTVRDVTGKPARTYEEWVRANAAAFA